MMYFTLEDLERGLDDGDFTDDHDRLLVKAIACLTHELRSVKSDNTRLAEQLANLDKVVTDLCNHHP